MKSGVINIYKNWLKTATPEEVAFVDAVFALGEANYDNGGDTLVECFDPDEILAEFKDLNEAKEFCGIRCEQALNARWGEENDPQVKTMQRYEKNWQDAIGQIFDQVVGEVFGERNIEFSIGFDFYENLKNPRPIKHDDDL